MIQTPSTPCTKLISLGEQELAAFIRSVTEAFGAEQARVAVEDWLEAVTLLDCDSTRPGNSWRLVTIAATTQFVRRVAYARRSATECSGSKPGSGTTNAKVEERCGCSLP